jgi:ribosomal protein S18 acetylase RimI-like enzyme
VTDIADAVAITRERPDTPDARRLIGELDAHLAPRYPPSSRHAFSVDRLIEEGVEFFVLRSGGEPAACGGILFVEGDADADEPYGEVKRMYVAPAFRGEGLGKRILRCLADEAIARGVSVLRLETGIHQVEAIGLYERTGFTSRGPFGSYIDDPLCAYYEKRLDEGAARTDS